MANIQLILVTPCAAHVVTVEQPVLRLEPFQERAGSVVSVITKNVISGTHGGGLCRHMVTVGQPPLRQEHFQRHAGGRRGNLILLCPCDSRCRALTVGQPLLRQQPFQRELAAVSAAASLLAAHVG
jgi:hypothetical protein